MSRSRTLYRVAAWLAVISFAMGLWKILDEGRINRRALWQLIIALIVLRIALTMYRRSRRGV